MLMDRIDNLSTDIERLVLVAGADPRWSEQSQAKFK